MLSISTRLTRLLRARVFIKMGFFRTSTLDKWGVKNQRTLSLPLKTIERPPQSPRHCHDKKNQEGHDVGNKLESPSTEPSTSDSSDGSNSSRGGSDARMRAVPKNSRSNNRYDSRGRRQTVSTTISRSRSNRSRNSIAAVESKKSKAKTYRTDYSSPGGEDAVPLSLSSDMIVLADGIHLDHNTKELLAAYDAKTVEDFFLMGDNDFHHLIAKARAVDRSLPPLQIRKVRILREWITDLIHESDPSKLPVWAQPGNINNHRRSRSGDCKDVDQTLVPKDWKKSFKRDLPILKKKLRERGDSFSDVFPWFSYFFTFRDTFCGGRCS